MEHEGRLSEATDNEGKDAGQARWNDADGLSPSVSNLRVGGLRRRTSSACCLNVFLSSALLVALAAILYFVISPMIDRLKTTTKIEVTTFCGKIRGTKEDGVVQFLGIPYALPPLGKNRFKHPVELTSKRLCAKGWQNHTADKKGFWETTDYKSPCMQLTPITDEVVGSEDCLYLNVFVPPSRIQSEDTKPVVIIINGLFFMYGSSNGLPISAGQQPHPRTVKTVDAIHVTFNYRVGPLGFFVHPLTKEANIGLYDQLAALRWVRNNIGAFGGDPTRVTLFGYGSGATSVLALSHSQLAQNLFDGIWMSAPAVGKPSISIDESVNTSLYLFGCDSNMNGKTLDQCIQYYDKAENVVRLWNWKRIEPWLRDRMFSLPSIQSDNTQKLFEQAIMERMLVDDRELIEAEKWFKPSYAVPVVIGQTAHETSLYVAPTTVPFWDENFYRQYLNRKLNTMDSVEVKKLIERYISETSYFNGDCRNASDYKQFDVEAHMTALVTDARLTCPLVEIVKDLVAHGDLVYQYYLRNSHRRFDPYSLASFVSLAFHGWDGMIYLRGYLTHPDYQESMHMNNGVDELSKISDILNRVMRDFVSSGKIDQWKHVSEDTGYINLIEDDTMCTKQKYLQARCDLWEQLTNGETLRLAWQA
ncbi:unnamed protein product [Calicophoron daubneyi]|uniref:Carboxylesterase type B domain-containing protein n=1 Tax=Calicophoron daubneyi TaxID=300641 RepID=A0AAV2TAM9_CALDB